jgi:hypothetical protein
MFKFKTQKDQMLEERKRREALQAQLDKTELASTIAFVTLAETGVIDDETATEHTDLFSPWVEGIAYEVGNIRSYEGDLYRCVQAHTSQSDWTPDKVPALWTKIGDPTEEFPEWSQPVGAHDAYAKGDKVSFGGKHWESTVDNNVWQPGVYGWNEV